ncbi:MAG: hypothetical protein Q7J25_06350, partial [Vicinamibacterales bacterium]|nr:hypothetical protein [Vicinamibacterales bacterium]
VEMRPFGGQPFQARVSAIAPPGSMRLEYVHGFITGQGEWRLAPRPAGTRVCYELNGSASGGLATMLARVMSLPKLHSEQMQAVLQALARVVAERAGSGTAATTA